ncbi:MAG: AMP-binding protein, partial [bacterium]|nr:AMP-binding protein [bacterium]
CLSLTAISFDVSVAEVFIPLSFGSSMVLMPDANIFDVENLSGMLLDESITFTYIPPSLLTAVFEKLSQHAAKVKINKMLVGVEPIADSVLENYQRLNPSIRIVNAYGPTEATICATACVYSSHEPTGAIVSIGAPLDNTRVFILDRELRLTPPGTTGELCIAGEGLARGYLNNPQLTAEKFVPNPFAFETQSPTAGNYNYVYRTGDQARWLKNGNIRFLGRIDTQVKIRGFRIEMGEIETRLRELEEIENAVVSALREDIGENYLCAYIVTPSEEEIQPEELRRKLAENLPDYMIPVYFMRLDSIPLTTSGKVDVKALPKPQKGTIQQYVAPRDHQEEKLAEIWSQVLAVEKEQIGIDTNFFSMGGHSLKATLLTTRIHKEFAVKVPLAEIFKKPDIRGLAQYIKTMEKETYHTIEAAAKKEYYVLSSAQKRVYIIQQMDKNDTSYNLPIFMQVEGRVNKERLENAFLKMIQRHESFRTSFELVGEEPVQRIHHQRDITFFIEVREIPEPRGAHDHAKEF